MQTSTRFGVSYPVAARTDPADVAVHIGNVVTGLERAVRYDSGTLAARPTSSVGTPGITGRHYFATDENQMYFDYGTGWIGIIVQNQKQISTLNASAATNAYLSYMTGDTQPRFVINADGKHQWGAGGAAALDALATLYRSGAGMLSTDGTMIVNGSLYVSTTAHAIWVQNINAAFSAFLVKAAADVQQRFRMLGDGKMQWGPGGSTVEDTTLYRSAAGTLKTDGIFVAQTGQVLGAFTTAQRNAISAPPYGLRVLNSDTSREEINIGTPGAPNWQPVGTIPLAPNTLALRPAANAVAAGTPFYATDQDVEYVSNGAAWVRKGSQAGDIFQTFNTAAGTGRILAQGQAWPSTTGIYADLFAKIGAAYPTVLPDLRARTLVAQGTHADVTTIGSNDGTAIASRRPKHNHVKNGTVALTGAPSLGSLAVTGAPGVGSLGTNRSADVQLGDPTHTHSYGYGGNINAGNGPYDITKDDYTGNQSVNYAGTGVYISQQPTFSVVGAPSLGSLAVGGVPGIGSLAASDTITIGPQAAAPTDGPAYFVVQYELKL